MDEKLTQSETEITDIADKSPIKHMDSRQSTSSESEDTISKLIDEDPLVVHKHFFHIKQHNESDYISACGFNHKIMCIGTVTGVLYKI